jgi:hypothetical protein
MIFQFLLQGEELSVNTLGRAEIFAMLEVYLRIGTGSVQLCTSTWMPS